MLNQTKKSLLITDSDLDGIGCALIGSLYIDDLTILYQTIYTYKDIVNHLFVSGEINKYDTIYVTDISIDSGMYSYITDLSKLHSNSGIDKFIFIDHHQESLWLKGAQNTYISTTRIISLNSLLDNSLSEYLGGDSEYKNRQASATRLFLEYLVENNFLSRTNNWEIDLISVLFFVEMVSRYDTWEWKNLVAYNDENYTFRSVPKQLNDLFYFYGIDCFFETMKEKFLFSFNKNTCAFNFLSDENKVLAALESNTKSIIKERMKSVRTQRYHDFNIAYTYSVGRNIISEFADEYLKLHPEIDIFVQIDIINNSCHLRTHQYNNINVAALANCFAGGGGHKKAAAFKFSKEIMDNIDILPKIFAESICNINQNISKIKAEK